MAMAKVSCTSLEIDAIGPREDAAVEKRAMIAEISSTSSMGIGPPERDVRREQAAQLSELVGLVVDRSGATHEDSVAASAVACAA